MASASFSFSFSSPLVALLLLFSASASASASDNATIYSVLPLYGLPPGIFPATVTAFSLEEGGALTVNLSGPCYVEAGTQLYYAPTVTGVLRYGSLSDLHGLQTRRFLIWLDVDRIKVSPSLVPPSLVPPHHIFILDSFSDK